MTFRGLIEVELDADDHEAARAEMDALVEALLTEARIRGAEVRVLSVVPSR